MLPRSAHSDLSNGRSRYAESLGHSKDGGSGCVFGTNDSNDVVRQFRHAASLTAPQTFRMFARSALIATSRIASALSKHVVDVIGARAQKQMIRIHARWHVALMAHVQAVWRNLSGSQFVRDSVGETCLTSVSKVPIALRVQATSPQPAAVGLLDLRPETCGYSGGCVSGCKFTCLRTKVDGVWVALCAAMFTRARWWAQRVCPLHCQASARVRAVAKRPRLPWLAALFANFGRFISNHIDLQSRVARGAVGADYTVAPRSLYRYLVSEHA